jgi:hypothetical protein
MIENNPNVTRVEYDAYRTDLEYYGASKDSEANQQKLSETQISFNNKKVEFEKLRADVQIKLKFLDDNRVSCFIKCFLTLLQTCSMQLKVMAAQLLMFHTSTSAYFSGNQAALEENVEQFTGKVKIIQSLLF